MKLENISKKAFEKIPESEAELQALIRTLIAEALSTLQFQPDQEALGRMVAQAVDRELGLLAWEGRYDA